MTQTVNPPPPTLAPGADTGLSSTDSITDLNAPTFVGVAAPNATINLYDTDGSLIGTGTAGTTGLYSIIPTMTFTNPPQTANGTATTFTAAATLDDGVHRITVTATAPGDSVSLASAPLIVAIDSQAPDAPTAPVLIAASDTGTSALDGITSATTITLTGMSEPGATVQLSDGTTALGSTVAAGDGSYGITTGTLASGAHSFIVIATDIAGNASKPSGATAVTIDTTPPPAPAAPTLAPRSDTGVLRTDGVTSDTTPVVTGTAEAGATVRLNDQDGTLLGQVVAGSDGFYAITSTTLLAGAHALTVSATDPAGNVGAASAALNILIDTAPPTAISTVASVPAAAGSVTFTVTFSQAIFDRRGITPDDFRLVTTGTAFGNIDQVTGSFQTGQITVDGIGGEGTIELVLAGDSEITDVAGNAFVLTSAAVHAVSGTEAGVLEAVSAGPSGVVGTGQDPSPSLSGRYVAFDSTFDSGTVSNVYVKNMQTGGLTRISAGTDGPANGDSSLPSLAGNGSAIAFVSLATNLVPGGTPAGQTNVYVAALTPADPASGDSVSIVPGSIQLVSAGNGQTGSSITVTDSEGHFFPDSAVLSSDGSTVAFDSDAALVPGVEAGQNNVYSFDVATGALTLITAGDGTAGLGDNGSSIVTSISADGTEIAFQSSATNLGNPLPVMGAFQSGPPLRSYVFNTATGKLTVLDGYGIFGATPDSDAYETYNPQLSADGTEVTYSVLFESSGVILQRNLVTGATMQLAGTKIGGYTEIDDDATLSASGSYVAYDQNDLGLLGAESPNQITVVQAASPTDVTQVSDGYQPVITANANVVAFSAPFGDGTAVYEASLGVTAGIDAVDGTDDIGAGPMAAIKVLGNLAITGDTNAPVDSMISVQIGQVPGAPGPIITGTVTTLGRWTVLVPAPTVSADGDYLVAVTIAAAAGQSAKVTRTFTIDTTPPSTPDSPKLDAGSDTGLAHDGSATDTGTPTVTGSAEAGSTVTLIDQGGLTPGLVLGTGIADRNGIYAITSIALTQGQHGLAVTATDDAGNVSDASAPLSLIVDAIVPDAPQAPGIAPAPDDTAFTGSSFNDPPASGTSDSNTAVPNPSGDGLITKQTTLTLSGTALPGARVTLYDSDGIAVLGTSTADAKGNYSITSSALSDGLHTLTVTQTKQAGDVSAASTPLDLTVDTLPPLSPVITSLGGPMTANAEHTTQVDVNGTAEPGSTVALHVDMDNNVSGTATVDPEGDYTIDGIVAAGVHKLTVIATDAVGNASQPSTVVPVTVDAASVPALGTPTGTAVLVGNVSDDEIFGATVFEDANGNGVLDPNEVVAVTDATGQYTLVGGSGPLVATGGKDIGSGLTLPGNLTAPAGSTAITPLTTLLDAYIAAGGPTDQGGNNPFLFDLDLPQLTDVTTLDPAAAAKAGTSFTAEADSAEISDAAVQIAAVIAGAGGDAKAAFADVFDLYARRLIAETGAALTDPANISALLYAAAAEALPGVTLNAAAVQAAAAIIAAGETTVRATEQTAIDDAGGAIDAGGPDVQREVTVVAGTFVRAIDAIETEEQGPAATALTQLARDPVLAAATQAQFTGASLSASLQQLTALYYTAIRFAPGDDTGASAFDHVTTDDTPTFIGTTTPSATVTLVDNSNANGITGLTPTQVLGTAVADSSGRFAVTSSALPTNTLLGIDQFGLEAVVSGVNGSLAPVSGSTVPVTPLEFYIATEAGPNYQQFSDITDVTDAPGPGSDATHQRVMVKVAAGFLGTINVYVDGGATPVGTAVLSAEDSDGYLLIETSPLTLGSHLFTITDTLQGGTVVPGNNTRTFVVTADPMSQGVAYGNGAIAGATLEVYTSRQLGFADAANTPTGQAGGYTFPTAAKVELLGGWDTVTDLQLGGNQLPADEDPAPFVQLDAPAGAAVVTALTSLVAEINGRGLNSGMGYESLAQAEAAILDGLGLSPDLDLLSLNPLAEAQAGDTAPFLTEAKLLDTQAIVFDAAGLDILPLLAIDIFNNGSLDLDDPAALLSILTSLSAHVAQPLAQTLATLVAASNTDLDALADAAPDNASLITGTLAEEEVAQDGEGRAAFDAAFNDTPAAALQLVTQAYTGAALEALIAAKLGQSAQVASFTAAAGTTSSAPAIHYTLQFTQPVSGIGAGAFQLIEGSGLADAFISSVTPVPGSGGASYDVAVSTGIGQGTLGIGFTGSGVLSAAGKPLTSGLFEPGQTYTAPFSSGAAEGLAAGDFNGDGKLDLVEAERNSLSGDGLTIFLNNGDGTFTETGQIALAVGGAGAVPAVGDFNGDSKLDIVTSIAGDNDVAVLLGNGDGTFQAPVRTATGNDPEALAVGDLDGDGRADVVTLNGDGTISVLLGQGNGTFLAAPPLASGASRPNQGFFGSIALADLNGDGKLDIVATDSVNNVVDIFLGDGDGTFGPELSVPTARGPTGVAVGDIDGDGIPDIVTADYDNNQVSILLGDGDGTFQADRPITLSTLEPAGDNAGQQEPLDIAIADVNNDGKADLIINGAGSTLVLIGDGTGNFQLADEDDSHTQKTVSSQALAVGDFDGDGRTDFTTPGVAVADDDDYGIDVHLNATQTVLDATAPSVLINRAALAQPELTQTSGGGTLNQSGNTYTLDLGTLSQGEALRALQFAVSNAAAAPADALTGTFQTAADPGFTVTGDSLSDVLDAGQNYAGLTVTPDTSTQGAHTETIVFAPLDMSATTTTYTTDPGSDTPVSTTTSVDGANTAAELPALTLRITDVVEPATVICYLRGTGILTESGEVNVEDLSIGDRVITLSGDVRPVTWIGTGQVLATRGRRTAATPVIVRKGALAPNVPHTDLRVTKGHSFYLDGVLIPVEFLVNHRSILWDDRAQEVTIYHIELETHDVLLANGAPAESYRDDGNRWLFQNANSGWHLPPQEPYAPVLTGGPVVDSVWLRLLDRAGLRPGLPLTDDPDLHLLVDGNRLDAATRTGGIYVFTLRETPAELRLISRASVPQELGLARDPRCLGVAMKRVVLRQGTRFRSFRADDTLLTDGYYPFEADKGFRWTDGDACLPSAISAGFRGPRELVLHLAATTQYVEGHAASRAA